MKFLKVTEYGSNRLMYINVDDIATMVRQITEDGCEVTLIFVLSDDGCITVDEPVGSIISRLSAKII